jgi:hypothetical protein
MVIRVAFPFALHETAERILVRRRYENHAAEVQTRRFPRRQPFPPSGRMRSADFRLAGECRLRLSCVMKTPKPLAATISTLLFGIAAMPSVEAQLPSLAKQPWIGFYAGHSAKRFEIGLSTHGDIVISSRTDKGDKVSLVLDIKIQVGIEEDMGNGKVVMRQIKTETLKSKEPATDKLEKVVVTGMTTGDAAFELNIEQVRGLIFIGGRMTDPGTLTKNPVNFGIRVKIPSLYKHSAPTGKKGEKEFGKKTEDDELRIKWTDGGKVKQTLMDAVLATSGEINGPGINSVELESAAYRGRSYVFTAGPNSAISLWNSGSKPLHEGFSINWKADAAKDKDGKARLAIEVK